MARLSLSQLERYLSAADILQGKSDPSEFKAQIFGILFLKRLSDVFEERYEQVVCKFVEEGWTKEEARLQAELADYYADIFQVPQEARWSYIRDGLKKDLGTGLNKAFAALEAANPTLQGLLRHIDFNRRVGRRRLTDRQLRHVIRRFDRYRLRDEDFDFPDLLGVVSDYLISQLASAAAAKGGDFYTPPGVARLLVRLLKPREGMSVYDPHVRSGGTLIVAGEYVEEHGGSAQNLALHGQIRDQDVWAICGMNLILHDIVGADVRHGDALVRPLCHETGDLMRFDQVIGSPPFDQNYRRSELTYQERFRHGFAPQVGKKASLMFLQHMHAVLRPGGMLAAVIPQSALFQRGSERQIRKGFIDEDVLEAVIGLPANLFYGDAPPTSIVVMRAPGAKPPERRGKVLFINADAEYHPAAVLNDLRPEHIHKIASAFEAFADVSGYAAVVTREELARNAYNLHIRRYVDNTPPPEPHDVRAHLLGGVPRDEVEAKQSLFAAHGYDPLTILVERDTRYYDFAPWLIRRNQIRPLIESDLGVQAREVQLQEAFRSWWQAHRQLLMKLPETQDLMVVRKAFVESFSAALAPVGLLDRFNARGVIESWWYASLDDLKTLTAQGFDGLINSWGAAIQTGLEEGSAGIRSNGADPSSHKLVARVLGDYREEIASLEVRLADIESQLATTRTSDEDDHRDIQDEEALSEEEIVALEREQQELRNRMKVLEVDLFAQLEHAGAALSQGECERLVLDALQEDLAAGLERYVAAHRQQVIAAVETWWDKYQLTALGIESERNARIERLIDFLIGIKYV